MWPPLSLESIAERPRWNHDRAVRPGSFAHQAGQRCRRRHCSESLALARHVEALGYRRYWLAEHHNMPGIASAATAVAIGHVAAGTKHHPRRRRRHHAAQPCAAGDRRSSSAPWPRFIPGRIDLGLGRAPGTDPRTALALRRDLQGDVDNFPQDVQELLAYLRAQPAGPGGARHSRRRHQCAGVDFGLQPLRRPARRGAGIALRLRLAFRARRSGDRAPALPPQFRPSP